MTGRLKTVGIENVFKEDEDDDMEDDEIDVDDGGEL